MNRKWLIDTVRASTGRTAVLPILSDLLGISEISVCAKMRGKTQFRPDEIDKIRIAFDLTDADVVNAFIKQGEQK